MRFSRGSGILLHPTSLPGDLGIGDLGPAAWRFIDFLARAGQTYWQILPLGPTGYGDSPYQSFSAFAGNTLLISPERLVDDGLLGPDDLAGARAFDNAKVDYGSVYQWKTDLLGRAYERFSQSTNADLSRDFEEFCHENRSWLDDYTLYRSIKTSQQHKPWYEWPDDLKLRDQVSFKAALTDLNGEVRAEKFYQFLFFRQWFALKEYANANGIRVIGDMPIFIALDSADVWCNRDKFKLNEDGTAKFVAGVPPDYFSKTGQLWGNPIYDWDAMQSDNFGWWTARLAFSLSTVDIVRLDHFIGFVRHWQVPGGDKTAENGEWVDVPGRDLFMALDEALGELPVIAEDLGSVTPEVEEFRDELDFPGMRILQYGFGGDAKNRDLPHNYVRNCVAYTGTHDNDTLLGWYKGAPRRVRMHCRKYLHLRGREIHWEMIRGVLASVADISILPMQDVLGLGSESRMNTPATSSGNWQWRLGASDLSDETADRLSEMVEIYGRAGDGQ